MAFTEGTIEEKRLFLRAFLKGIKLDPTDAIGQAMILPGLEKVSSNGCNSINGEFMINADITV